MAGSPWRSSPLAIRSAIVALVEAARRRLSSPALPSSPSSPQRRAPLQEELKSPTIRPDQCGVFDHAHDVSVGQRQRRAVRRHRAAWRAPHRSQHFGGRPANALSSPPGSKSRYRRTYAVLRHIDSAQLIRWLSQAACRHRQSSLPASRLRGNGGEIGDKPLRCAPAEEASRSGVATDRRCCSGKLASRCAWGETDGN